MFSLHLSIQVYLFILMKEWVIFRCIMQFSFNLELYNQLLELITDNLPEGGKLNVRNT